jgi:hypothetical protein
LLPSGSCLVAGFAFANVALYHGGEDGVTVKLLLFDSKQQTYILRTVNL